MVCRKKKSKPQTRAEMAMTPMTLTTSTDNRNNDALDGASGKTNPAPNTQTTKNNDYIFSSFDQPSTSAAAGDIDYEPSTMYDSLSDNPYSKL